MAKPFLKWVGGKQKLLPIYKDLFPHSQDFTSYCEPFLGGGAVFFYLKELYPNLNCYLGDSNAELIATYRKVRDGVQDLIANLKELQECHSKEYYYIVRNKNFSYENSITEAARFIYLNKTCFNGLYRTNKKGKFNVPIGDYKNPAICDVTTLIIANYLLKSTRLIPYNYKEFVSMVFGSSNSTIDRTFIYLDPPYHPISATSNFTTYTKDGFTSQDQIELAETFKDLNKRGAKVMLSNSDCEFIRDLYKDFNITDVLASRAINSKGEKRGKIGEIVVRNYS